MNVLERLEALAALATATRRTAPSIWGAAALLRNTLRIEGTVFVCGNGGSMAQAMHLAGELTGRYRRERRPLPAVVLGADPVHASCVANDYGAEHVFARHLEALAQPRDVLVCLTTSGRSPNVRAAAEMARRLCMPSMAITGSGPDAGWWSAMSAHVAIPSEDTALVQELTLSVIHSICEHIDGAVADGE